MSCANCEDHAVRDIWHQVFQVLHRRLRYGFVTETLLGKSFQDFIYLRRRRSVSTYPFYIRYIFLCI